MRPDRDNHVKINFDNIKLNTEINFLTYDGYINTFGIPYDLTSLMHYGAFVSEIIYSLNNFKQKNLFSEKSFSKNSLKTIETNDPEYQKTIGQRNDLSFWDIKTVNNVYCKSITSKMEFKRLPHYYEFYFNSNMFKHVVMPKERIHQSKNM